jgi:hypothetical protein
MSQKLDNKIIYLGLAAEVLLSLALSETLFMINLIGTRDLIFRHYGLAAIPFGIIQFTMDEIRKYLIRNLPKDNFGHPDRK